MKDCETHKNIGFKMDLAKSNKNMTKHLSYLILKIQEKTGIKITRKYLKKILK